MEFRGGGVSGSLPGWLWGVETLEFIVVYNLSFFWFGNLGMWRTGMVFDQFFYGYCVWLVSAWAYASGCGR